MGVVCSFCFVLFWFCLFFCFLSFGNCTENDLPNRQLCEESQKAKMNYKSDKLNEQCDIYSIWKKMCLSSEISWSTVISTVTQEALWGKKFFNFESCFFSCTVLDHCKWFQLDHKDTNILHSGILFKATLLLLCVQRTVCWSPKFTQLQLQLFCRSLAEIVLRQWDRKRGGKGVVAARGGGRLGGTEMTEGVWVSEP